MKKRGASASVPSSTFVPPTSVEVPRVSGMVPKTPASAPNGPSPRASKFPRKDEGSSEGSATLVDADDCPSPAQSPSDSVPPIFGSSSPDYLGYQPTLQLNKIE